MTSDSRQTFQIVQGEAVYIDVDWGENTDGSETGWLKDGDTLTGTPTVSAIVMPSGATTPTLGAVSVGSTTKYIRDRQCTTGEWTRMLVTAASNQVVGDYKLRFVATTTGGATLKPSIALTVIASAT